MRNLQPVQGAKRLMLQRLVMEFYTAVLFDFDMNTNGKAKGPNKAPITTQNGMAALRFLATE